jgi:hypothetical protein
MTPICARCERELADGAYVCAMPCAFDLAADLTQAAGHADDAPTVVARQVRYGPGGGRGNEQPLPVNLAASDALWAVENTITTWARHVADERGLTPFKPPSPILGPLCSEFGRCPHGSCKAIERPSLFPPTGKICSWLSDQLGWLRHRPEAGQAWDELDDACRMLRQLVDSPARRRIAGPCMCGRVLYALEGRTHVECPDCEMGWDVDELRGRLHEELAERIVTASEAARLLGYLGDDRTQHQLRNLVRKWGERGDVEIRDSVWRKPTVREIKAAKDEGIEPPTAIAVPVYRFGDVAVRLAQTPRRERRMAA